MSDKEEIEQDSTGVLGWLPSPGRVGVKFLLTTVGCLAILAFTKWATPWMEGFLTFAAVSVSAYVQLAFRGDRIDKPVRALPARWMDLYEVYIDFAQEHPKHVIVQVARWGQTPLGQRALNALGFGLLAAMLSAIVAATVFSGLGPSWAGLFSMSVVLGVLYFGLGMHQWGHEYRNHWPKRIRAALLIGLNIPDRSLGRYGDAGMAALLRVAFSAVLRLVAMALSSAFLLDDYGAAFFICCIILVVVVGPEFIAFLQERRRVKVE